MKPEQADTGDTARTQDRSDNVLTDEDIRELIRSCYAMDAELPMSGWEPLGRLVRKLEAMLTSDHQVNVGE